jgi:hypothetical protein
MTSALSKLLHGWLERRPAAISYASSQPPPPPPAGEVGYFESCFGVPRVGAGQFGIYGEGPIPTGGQSGGTGPTAPAVSGLKDDRTWLVAAVLALRGPCMARPRAGLLRASRCFAAWAWIDELERRASIARRGEGLTACPGDRRERSVLSWAWRSREASPHQGGEEPEDRARILGRGHGPARQLAERAAAARPGRDQRRGQAKRILDATTVEQLVKVCGMKASSGFRGGVSLSWPD